MTMLELNDQDAREFIEFRQHQAMFRALVEAGVFGVRGGQAVLNFNHEGTLMNIKIEMITWHKSKKEV